MAAHDNHRAAATGADQGDMRRRNVSGRPNGSYIPAEFDDKVDEKTKQKVDRSGSGWHWATGIVYS